VSLRKRPDLVSVPQWLGGRWLWLIKDPITLRYFHLLKEEWAVLNMLDGCKSLKEIVDEFDRRFVPLRLDSHQAQSFLYRLHRNGLVLSEASGQGTQLRLRSVEEQRRRWLNALTNPLTIRFRGMNPEPLLRALYPRCRWVFSMLSLGSPRIAGSHCLRTAAVPF